MWRSPFEHLTRCQRVATFHATSDSSQGGYTNQFQTGKTDAYRNVSQQKHPGGLGTVLVKTTLFFLLMLFSLQRNAHLYEPNLAKFSRDQFDRRFLLSFQTRRFSVEMFFCWSRACRFTYRHCQHFTYKRRSLLFEPHPSRSRIHRINNTRDLCSVATYNVRSTRKVNMAPPHPTPYDLRTHANKNARFTSTVFGPLAKTCRTSRSSYDHNLNQSPCENNPKDDMDVTWYDMIWH